MELTSLSPASPEIESIKTGDWANCNRHEKKNIWDVWAVFRSRTIQAFNTIQAISGSNPSNPSKAGSPLQAMLKTGAYLPLSGPPATMDAKM